MTEGKKPALRGDRTKFTTKKTPGQQRYLKRQSKDQYVKQAQGQGYRSRAAYKLLEIQAKFPVLLGAQVVVDLGAAPGGWCQVVQQLRPQARIIACDLLEMPPISGVTFVQGDFTTPDVLAQVHTAMGGDGGDVVLSDMAANTIGHPATDHLRSMMLAEAAAACALDLLKPGGNFVCKFFQGGGEQALKQQLTKEFTKLHFVKPPSSRQESREMFLVALGRTRG